MRMPTKKQQNDPISTFDTKNLPISMITIRYGGDGYRTRADFDTISINEKKRYSTVSIFDMSKLQLSVLCSIQYGSTNNKRLL